MCRDRSRLVTMQLERHFVKALLQLRDWHHGCPGVQSEQVVDIQHLHIAMRYWDDLRVHTNHVVGGYTASEYTLKLQPIQRNRLTSVCVLNVERVIEYETLIARSVRGRMLGAIKDTTLHILLCRVEE